MQKLSDNMAVDHFWNSTDESAHNLTYKTALLTIHLHNVYC